MVLTEILGLGFSLWSVMIVQVGLEVSLLPLSSESRRAAVHQVGQGVCKSCLSISVSSSVI